VVHSRTLPPRLRRLALVSLVVMGSGGACAPDPAGPPGTLTASVRIALGAEEGTAQQPRAASVVAGVTLAVVTPTGSSFQQAPFGTRSPLADFQVSVPEGEVTFQAEVTSTTGVVLYRGDTTVPVLQDGFQVEIPLQAVAPVLVVESDSIRSTPTGTAPGPGRFVLVNRGIGTVVWRVAAVSPTQPPCAEDPCLLLTPSSGTVSSAAGATAFLRAEPSTTPARVYTLRLETDQGTVDVRVDAGAAGMVEARVRQGSTGPPMPGVAVRLMACSFVTQTQACVPDESMAPVTRSTDSLGIVRFTGAHPGFWELRPSRPGVAFTPPARVFTLTPGGVFSQLFQGQFIVNAPGGDHPGAGVLGNP